MESRKYPYLFKLRRTAKARELVAALERTTTTAWTDAGQGWQGCESCLRLQGWNRARRVVVLRRRLNDQRHPRARRRLVREQADHALLLNIPDAAACEPIIYEHQILVTSLPYEILTLATLYRERGGAENPFDELKNQWSWSGFTSQELNSCQHAARLAALTQELAPVRDPASEEVKETLRGATEAALTLGVFGVPTIEVDGRLFWGLDSLEMLAAYLKGDAWFEQGDWEAAAVPRPGLRRAGT